MLTDSEATHP